MRKKAVKRQRINWKKEVEGLRKTLSEMNEAHQNARDKDYLALNLAKKNVEDLRTENNQLGRILIATEGDLKEAKLQFADSKEITKAIRRSMEAQDDIISRYIKVVAVLSVHVLRQMTMTMALKEFIVMADEMGFAEIEKMLPILEESFLRAGEEVHNMVFVSASADFVAGVLQGHQVVKFTEEMLEDAIRSR